MKLEDLACNKLNKRGMGTNKQHVKNLGDKIYGTATKRGEGLQLWIYRRGMAVEPSLENPTEHAVSTNDFAKKQGGLSMVAVRAFPGMMAKTHLWHLLWTTKNGGMGFIVNKDDEELMFTLYEEA